MKEAEVSYIAGVVDSVALFRIQIESKEEYNTGYKLRPKVELSRSGTQSVVLGMIDEYCTEVGVMPKIQENPDTTSLILLGVDKIERFLEPIEPWLIQKHEQLDIFLGEILPKFEEDKHLDEDGIIEIAEKMDEMYELDPSMHQWKYSADYFKEELAE